MVKVKICGHTNVEDALSSVKLGADAIGVVVEVPVATPRKISSEKAKVIISKLPVFTPGIVVIMPKSLEEVIHFCDIIKPYAVQLQGKESVDLVREVRERVSCRIIKAIHIREESVVEEAVEYSEHCDAILLDTMSKMMGGSGITHNWDISREVVKAVGKPVILAGGLTPDNVKDAIKKVRPYAVDVSSRIEKDAGKKDFEKVKRFIENAKSQK